jgi:imidazolonepropionase-like amidohydrolase
MKNIQVLLAAFVLAATTPAFAQDLLIRNANVHTVSDIAILGGDVMIRDGMIATVGKVSSADAAKFSADQIIDAKGKTVLPGFFAGYTQLGLVEVDMVDSTNDTRESSGWNTAEVRAMDGYNALSELIPVARLNGITEALVAPATGNIFNGQSAIVSLSGTSMERALHTSPAALHITLGEGPKQTWDAPGDGPKSRMGTASILRAEFQKALEYKESWARYQEKYAKFQLERAGFPDKLRKWNEDTSPDKSKDEPEEPEAPNRRRRISNSRPSRRPSVAASVVRSMRNDSTTSKRCFASPRSSSCRPFSSVVRMPGKSRASSQKKKFPSSCSHRCNPRAWETSGAIYESARILNEAGVKIAFFTGDTAHGVRNLPYEAGLAVAYGLPADVAIRAITLSPAEIWGVSEFLGAIKSGYRANLIIVDGDPLQPMTHVTNVIIGGEQMEMRSRQTDLAEKYGAKFLTPKATP